MSSSGVVNVLPGENNIAGDFEPEKSPHEQREVSRDCFYNLCERSSYWDGWVVCGTFKSRNSRLFCTFFTLMIISVFLAVIAPLALYSLADDSINSEVVIDSTSATNYESWSTNAYGSGFDDIKVKYDLYYFDLQNAEDVLAGAKPVVTEVGPYAYDEYFVKFDIEWTDGGDTVAYNTQKYYIFNQERTGPGLSEFDELMLPYATVVGFEYLLGELPPEVSAYADYKMLTALHEKHDVLANNLTTIYNMVPKPKKFDPIRTEISQTNDTLNMLFNRMYAFVEESHAVDLLLKTLLCPTPSGLSPFFKVQPGPAWFGWLKDPILEEVQLIINKVNSQLPEGATPVAWTSAVPGASTNWTTIEDTRRRRSRDVFKTGKKNKNQVAQYVQFNGMDVDKYHVCVSPMKSQDPTLYTENEQFPACAYYNNDWTDEEATAKGYNRPFATPYANRLHGTDANMFGRPVRGDKMAVFVSDIYRSCFLENKGLVDWNGVDVRRYGLQIKDMWNATANPENAQYYNYGPSGMENTTNAAGIPVFVSFPHFYLGDDRLVAAIKGLDPNVHKHETFIDVEPQSGLLARAEKKLQVNYLMENKKLPQTQDDSLSIAHAICANITEVEAAIAGSDAYNGTALPTLHCNNTLIDSLFTCLNAPADWTFQDDAIFFPFGWASEQMTLPDSTATDLNDSLFLIDDIAVAIRFWCLIIAGLCFAVLLSMVATHYLDIQERGKEHVDRAHKENVLASASQPLIAGSAPPADKFSSFSA